MSKEENANRPASPALGAFGKIYYPALAIVAVVLLVLSFVTYYTASASVDAGFDTAQAVTRAEQLAGNGERNSWSAGTGNTSDDAVEIIGEWLSGIDGLTDAEARRVNENHDKDDGYDMDVTADFATTEGVPSATYVWQDLADPSIDYTVDNDTVYAMTGGDYAGTEGVVYAGRQPNNLIVVIPGSVTRTEAVKDAETPGYGDAVLFMTHYDSDNNSVGYGGASAVAAMTSVIENIVSSGAEYENDLVFLISDGRYESSVGAYTFLYQFTGFGNVAGRIRAAFNFDAITSDGALTIVGTSDNDSGIMGAYMLSDGSAKADFALTDLISDGLSSDVGIFYDYSSETWRIPVVDLMITGGAYSETSPASDEAEQAWKNGKVTEQFAAEIAALAEYFGGCDLTTLTAATNAAAYTWLGTTGIATGGAVYTMSGILVALIVVAIALAVKFGGFGVVRALKGLGGVALVMGLSLAAFAAAYFILGSLMAAFGVITLNMLTTAKMMSPALLVPAIAFAAAVSCGFYPIIKKGFKVKAADCVRGGALMLAVIGAAFGFAYPQAALPFIITGLALMAVMIASTMLKRVFREKFGFGIERLFLYTIPMMFALPFLVQTIMTAGVMVVTYSVIFLLLAVTLLLSSITPYFDYLQPVMTDAFAKLPKHTVPVIETVTEEVENEVKKGRYTTVTEERLVKHKVAWNYHNWFGVLVLCVVTIAALLLSCSLGAYAATNFALNRTTAYDYKYADIRDSVFDNSVVCYINGSSGSTGTYTWLIKDEAVYRNVKYAAGDDFDWWNWSWNGDTFGGAYEMTVNSDASANTDIFSKPDSDSMPDGYDVVSINPVDSAYSQVFMTVSGIDQGDKLTIYEGDISDPSEGSLASTIYHIEFNAPADEVEIVLPYGTGSCTMFVETDGTVRTTGYCYNTSGNQTIVNAGVDYRAMRDGYIDTYGYSIGYAEIIYDAT